MAQARRTQRSRVLITIRGSVAVAYCLGTLDRSVVDDLAARLRTLAFDGVRGVVLALERTTHIHFQALEPLTALHRLMREAGGRLVLAGASPYLKQILDFGGVPGQVSVVPDRLEAIQELSGTLPVEGSVSMTSVQQSLL
ncbi:MAG: STAS domain-containing protein [Candidatus Latescibacterota bacterium]|nr:MAG: STAS domain-containing protein [Candidatus Latescibacterota bacterium]